MKPNSGRPILNAHGEWRSEVVHRMTRRLETWDYTACSIYSISIVLANRRSKVFGEIGERQIAREALAAKLPLVVMQNKGFSPLQKPPGRYFEACAEGRLLMIAPAAWEWTPAEKPMTRSDAAAMNRLCQWIAGEDAAEIDYHGMKHANIDALALAAVAPPRVHAEDLV